MPLPLSRNFLLTFMLFLCQRYTSSLQSPSRGCRLEISSSDDEASQLDSLDKEMKCWSEKGYWELNETMVLGRDIRQYAPCPITYGRRNPCRTILDSQSLRYYWTHGSGNCTRYPLTPFSASDFCSTSLSSGNILMIGDSITTLAGHSWKNQFMLSSGKSDCSSSSVPAPGTDVHKLQGCINRTLITVRNDRLSLINTTVDTTHRQGGRDFREHPWTHLILSHNISLVILNRGAHYENDTILLAAVNETLSYLVSNHPQLRIVWRNTPFGAADYILHTRTPPLHATPPVALNHTYDYDHFEHQNSLVQSLLRRVPSFRHRVIYLDAFTPSVRRLDSHQDALHPCVPGSLDTWLMLLHSALLLIRRFRAS